MKKLLIIFLLTPSIVFAQLSLPQGGTGRSLFTGGDFIFANSDSFQRLTGTTSPFFTNFSFRNATGTSATSTSFFSTKGTFDTLCIVGDCRTVWPTDSTASSTLHADNNNFSGANIFANITRSTTTNATSTTSFATTASSTNLFTTTLSAGTGAFGADGITIGGDTGLYRITADTLATFDSIFFLGTNSVISGTLSGSTSANGDLKLQSTTDVDRGNIILAESQTSTSHVGVGTSTPDARLDVVGFLGSQADIFNVSSTTATNIVSSLFKVSVTGLTSVQNLLLTGSSTLLNFTALNSTSTNATTTTILSTTASTTNFFGGGLVTCQSNFVLTWAGGKFGCEADDTGASAYDAWTHPSAGVSATTSSMIFTNASSTFTGHLNIVGNSTSTNSTSTNKYISGDLTVAPLTSALILTDTGGRMAEYAGTTCTNQFVRVLSALGAATCATVGTADVTGLDISDDTNLGATWPIILTGDTLSFGGLSTSSAPTIGQMPYWTGVNTFGSVATSSLVQSTGITIANGTTAYVIGAQPTFTVDQNFSPTWTGTHIFNNITRSTTTQATSTSIFGGQYTGSQLRIGATATSTINSTGDLLIVGSTTLQRFTATHSTTTEATSTNLFSTKGTFNTLCIVGDCRTVWPTGGGAGGNSKFATSTTTNYPADKGIFPNGGGLINLGLGTSTPQWQVQVASSTGAQFTLSDPSTITNNHWSFRNAGGLFYLATSSASTFATSTYSALSIDANGLLTFQALNSTTTNATSTSHFATTASSTNFFGAGLPGAGCSGSSFVQWTAGRFACGTPGGGGGTPNSKWATSTIDILAISPNSALRIGLGTTTPQWLLQLASSTGPQLTLSDPSTLTNDHWSFRNFGGRWLSIGTSSPTTYATTSTPVITLTSSSTNPYFASTTERQWGVLNVSTTTQTQSGDLWNLYVNGRYNDDTQFFREDFMGQIVSVTADTNSIRPGLLFDIDGGCTAASPGMIRDMVGILRLTAGGTANNGCHLDFGNTNTFATTSLPHLEIRARWQTATTGQMVLMGFANIAQNAVSPTVATAGAYFFLNTASSTFVQTVTRTSAILGSTTTTSILLNAGQGYTFNVMFSSSTAMFLIDGQTVAVHNLHLPNSAVEPEIFIERFGTAAAIDFGHIRVWADSSQ